MSEFVEPVGKRVLVRKDESRQKTRGGIVLPDAAEIPTITGRVVEVSVQVGATRISQSASTIRSLFHPKNAIPVDFEPDNLLFVVPIEDVVAVFRPARNQGTRDADRKMNRWAMTRSAKLTGSNRIERGGTKATIEVATSCSGLSLRHQPVRDAVQSPPLRC